MTNIDDTTQQIAAEEIRSHLVLLRGGAPFLSSSDACLLDSWLTEGVTVSSILFAIEKASEARRKRRSRTPLTLRQAKKHLKKVPEKTLESRTFTSVSGPEHPLAKLALKLRSQAEKRNNSTSLCALADHLVTLPNGCLDQLVRDALQLFREFLVREWDQLPSEQRTNEISSAQEELKGIAPHMEEAAFARLVEEVVRDRLRQQYPLLCSSALWDTLQTQPFSPVVPV